MSHLKQDCLKSVCVLGGPHDTDRFENIIAQFVSQGQFICIFYAN